MPFLAHHIVDIIKVYYFLWFISLRAKRGKIELNFCHCSIVLNIFFAQTIFRLQSTNILLSLFCLKAMFSAWGEKNFAVQEELRFLMGNYFCGFLLQNIKKEEKQLFSKILASQVNKQELCMCAVYMVNKFVAWWVFHVTQNKKNMNWHCFACRDFHFVLNSK